MYLPEISSVCFSFSLVMFSSFLVIPCILSCTNCRSALFMMSNPLLVFTGRFRCKLGGVISSSLHRSVYTLWFWYLPTFLSSSSVERTFLTNSGPYTDRKFMNRFICLVKFHSNYFNCNTDNISHLSCEFSTTFCCLRSDYCHSTTTKID